MAKKQIERQLADVELLAPHTHAGLDYKTGERITVTPEQADWLAQRGVAKTLTFATPEENDHGE